MKLDRQGREFYVLNITTTPPVAAPWEASFDSGKSWVPGVETVDGWRWLVRGPDCPNDPNIPSAVVAGTVNPMIRAYDHPELVIRRAPGIFLT